MLHDKNGVITEERFAKMTVTQWLFHYKEIAKFKELEIKKHDSTMSELRNLLLLVIRSSDPELAASLFKAINGEDPEKELGETDKEMLEILNSAPKAIMVTTEVDSTNNGVKKKRRKKEIKELQIIE